MVKLKIEVVMVVIVVTKQCFELALQQRWILSLCANTNLKKHNQSDVNKMGQTAVPTTPFYYIYFFDIFMVFQVDYQYIIRVYFYLSYFL